MGSRCQHTRRLGRLLGLLAERSKGIAKDSGLWHYTESRTFSRPYGRFERFTDVRRLQRRKSVVKPFATIEAAFVGRALINITTGTSATVVEQVHEQT